MTTITNRSPEEMKAYLYRQMEWVKESNSYMFRNIDANRLIDWLDTRGMFSHNDPKTFADIINKFKNPDFIPSREISMIANSPAAFSGADKLKKRDEDGRLATSNIGVEYKNFLNKVKHYFSQNLDPVIRHMHNREGYSFTMRMQNEGSLILRRLAEVSENVPGGESEINKSRSEITFKFSNLDIALQFFEDMSKKFKLAKFKMALVEDGKRLKPSDIRDYNPGIMKQYISDLLSDKRSEIPLGQGVPSSSVATLKGHKTVEMPTKDGKRAGISQKEWDKKHGQGRLF